MKNNNIIDQIGGYLFPRTHGDWARVFYAIVIIFFTTMFMMSCKTVYPPIYEGPQSYRLYDTQTIDNVPLTVDIEEYFLNEEYVRMHVIDDHETIYTDFWGQWMSNSYFRIDEVHKVNGSVHYIRYPHQGAPRYLQFTADRMYVHYYTDSLLQGIVCKYDMSLSKK